MVEAVPGTDDWYAVDTGLFGVEGFMSAYVLAGERPAICDPGAASGVGTILDALAELDVDPGDVAAIVPTHVHLDHGGAAGALADACPHATTYVHEVGYPYLTDPAKLDRLVDSATDAVGEAVAAAYGNPEPVPAERCEAVAGGDAIDLGEHTLSVIDAPGHAPHHACLLDDLSRVLVAGDAAGMARPGEDLRPTTPPPDFDLERWLETLDRLIEADPAVLCYAHFGPDADAVGAIERYRELLPQFVGDVASARETHGDSVDVVANALREQWGGITLDADVAGVLRYLAY